MPTDVKNLVQCPQTFNTDTTGNYDADKLKGLFYSVNLNETILCVHINYLFISFCLSIILSRKNFLCKRKKSSAKNFGDFDAGGRNVDCSK